MNEALRDIGLAIIADDDSARLLSNIERASILIACGDLRDAFILEAAKRCVCTTILAVKGNHDGAGVFPEPILNLHLRTVTISGVIFGGFGGAWRYKPRGNHLYEQEEVSEALTQFPQSMCSSRTIHRAESMIVMTTFIPGLMPSEIT